MFFDTKRKKQSSFTLKSHMHELIALIVFSVGLFLTISCFSYYPYDKSWFYYATEYDAIHNWCGIVGSYSSAFLFYFFGSMTYVFLVLVMMASYFIARKKTIYHDWERFIAFFIMAGAISALWSKPITLFGRWTIQSGALGIYLFSWCHYFFDEVGTALLLYTLCIGAFFVMTRLSIATLVFSFQALYAATQLLIKKYRVIQKISLYARLCVRGMYRFSQVWYQALASFVDGSIFYDAGYIAPEIPSRPDIQKEIDAEKLVYPDQQNAQNDIQEGAQHNDNVSIAYSGAHRAYMLPQTSLFIETGISGDDAGARKDLENTAKILEEKLKRFGVLGSVLSIKRGPVVTLFEYQPSIDTKLSKIVALEDDLALALQAVSIRILAPIPGRSVVGFEVSNNKRKDVPLSDIIRSTEFQDSSLALPLILGQNTVGTQVIVDLVKMPHLLIAGSTGSGKSIALNTMLMSLLCKCTPEELRLILIDPKRLEFASYADIAHLLFPIVTDPRKAAPILRWVVHQMEQRYEKMAQKGVRNIADYNKQVHDAAERLPFIVVIIDELADLMMTAGRDIEDLIARITQMARAAGIHMIVATQRPSVDVITGLIKVNFPSRISFRVTSKVDSRTILDCNGADKLLGRGDMLFLDSHQSILRRVHGAYVSDKEIEEVVTHIKMQQTVQYLDIMQELSTIADNVEGVDDDIFDDVVSFLQEIDDVSISLLQRKFKIGYNRSARIIERLESQGMIMPADGGKTRKVIR